MSEGDNDYDHDTDWYDFPPAAHPGREAFTITIAIVCLIGLIVWWLI